MSIGTLALRMALTHELRGRTIAGDAVYDSTIAPVDQFADGGDKPFISIAVEDQKFTDIAGRDLSSAERRIDLVVEIASGQVATFETPDGLASGISLNQTDAAKELTIDLIGRQVERGIIQPEDPVWGEILSGLLLKIIEVNIRRGIKSEGGSRLAFRQIVFSLELISEPAIGAEPQYVWQSFVQALENDPDTASLAPVVVAAIVGGAIPEHLQDWSQIGMRQDSANALRLLGPEGSTGAPSTLTGVSITAEP